MALEEVLKHECDSGFVVEISETDNDHREFLKMVVSPKRDEIGSPRIEIKDSRKLAEVAKKLNLDESDEQVQSLKSIVKHLVRLNRANSQ